MHVDRHNISLHAQIFPSAHACNNNIENELKELPRVYDNIDKQCFPNAVFQCTVVYSY